MAPLRSSFCGFLDRLRVQLARLMFNMCTATVGWSTFPMRLTCAPRRKVFLIELNTISSKIISPVLFTQLVILTGIFLVTWNSMAFESHGLKTGCCLAHYWFHVLHQSLQTSESKSYRRWMSVCNLGFSPPIRQFSTDGCLPLMLEKNWNIISS